MASSLQPRNLFKEFSAYYPELQLPQTDDFDIVVEIITKPTSRSNNNTETKIAYISKVNLSKDKGNITYVIQGDELLGAKKYKPIQFRTIIHTGSNIVNSINSHNYGEISHRIVSIKLIQDIKELRTKTTAALKSIYHVQVLVDLIVSYIPFDELDGFLYASGPSLSSEPVDSPSDQKPLSIFINRPPAAPLDHLSIDLENDSGLFDADQLDKPLFSIGPEKTISSLELQEETFSDADEEGEYRLPEPDSPVSASEISDLLRPSPSPISPDSSDIASSLRPTPSPTTDSDSADS